MKDTRPPQTWPPMVASPTFAEPPHVAPPNIGNIQSFLERVNQTSDNEWLTNNAQMVQECEQRIADHLDGPPSVVLASEPPRLPRPLQARGTTILITATASLLRP